MRLTRSRTASVTVAVSTAQVGRTARGEALFVGDVVGGIGRRTLAALLPGYATSTSPTSWIVNGENSAGGVGITRRRRASMGTDAITLGNHAYRHREVYELLDREAADRAANYPKGNPEARPYVVERDGSGSPVNLSGPVFLQAVRSPFAEADAVLAELRGGRRGARGHARRGYQREGGQGWHLDGRVTASSGRIRTGDGRRARPARRDGLHHRRGDDQGARRRDRRHRELAIERFVTLTTCASTPRTRTRG